MDTLTQENVVLSQNEPILPENPKKFNFLIILLSVLLFISTSIAVFFAYQTQKLVKELVILEKSSTPTSTVEPIMTPELTENWKTYPSSTTIGLSYSFKYPMTTEINEAQDLVYLKTGNATIYHRFLDKQTDLQSAMNNFKSWGTNESVVFSDDKKQISYGLLTGYKLTSSDGNNTFFFLGSNKLNGILVFHYPTVETSSGELLYQILSTFKFIDPDPISNWKTYTNNEFGFQMRYPLGWKLEVDESATTNGNREFRFKTENNEYISGVVFDGPTGYVQKLEDWEKKINMSNGDSLFISYTDNLGPGSKGGIKDIELFKLFITTFKIID